MHMRLVTVGSEISGRTIDLNLDLRHWAIGVSYNASKFDHTFTVHVSPLHLGMWRWKGVG